MSSYTNSIASIFLQGPEWSIFFGIFSIWLDFAVVLRWCWNVKNVVCMTRALQGGVWVVDSRLEMKSNWNRCWTLARTVEWVQIFTSSLSRHLLYADENWILIGNLYKSQIAYLLSHCMLQQHFTFDHSIEHSEFFSISQKMTIFFDIMLCMEKVLSQADFLRRNWRRFQSDIHTLTRAREYASQMFKPFLYRTTAISGPITHDDAARLVDVK